MNSFTRRQFTQGVVAASALQALGQGKKQNERKRPNVLFVIADEWRSQAFGHTGDSNAPTSAFDQFARESVNFEQMVSGLPVCCPMRATLLTGQYPLTHGVYINDVPLAPKVKTVGECFRDAGYNTGYIGKWHVYGSPDGHNGRRASFIPEDRHFGFEYWKVAECCHDYNQSFYYEGNDPTKKFWTGYDAQAQTEDACKFIQDHANSDKPYFLTVSWGPPHPPYNTAPEKYREMFAHMEITLRPNVAPERREEAIANLRGYYAHIAALNDCFRQLMHAVDSTDTRDDTIVVFISDHGDMMESEGLEMKTVPWEESARPPFLVRYPKRFGKTGIKSQALISATDVMPTLLGLCEITIPPGIQGTDFSDLKITRRTLGPAATAFLNMPVPFSTTRRFGIAEYRGVRDLRYTYVRSIKGPWLLYDNMNDPYQKHNLINKPEVKRVQANLEAQLSMWLSALKDEFLPSEEYLRRDHLTNHIAAYEAVIYTRSPWNDWESTLPAREFSVDSPIKAMLKNPQARAILERDVPQSIESPLHCIRQMQHMGLAISDQRLSEIDAELAKIPTVTRKPLLGQGEPV